MRGIPVIASIFSVLAPAQTFDVASIRPNRSVEKIMRFQPSRGGRFTATNCSLALLIQYAFDVGQFQIAGAPAWTHTERYDIAANSSMDSPIPEIPVRVQHLLEERFQLAHHWETKESAIYHLVVSKEGRLKPAAPGDCPNDAPCGGLRNSPGDTRGYRLTAQDIADSLTFFLQRRVLDHTGLTGQYDVELQWSRNSEEGPSVFTALQEQLGLKLDAARGQIRMFVVDRIERPTEN